MSVRMAQLRWKVGRLQGEFAVLNSKLNTLIEDMADSLCQQIADEILAYDWDNADVIAAWVRNGCPPRGSKEI